MMNEHLALQAAQAERQQQMLELLQQQQQQKEALAAALSLPSAATAPTAAAANNNNTITAIATTQPAAEEHSGDDQPHQQQSNAENDDDFEIPQRFTKSGRKRAIPFPLKLMKVLSNPNFKHIITWMPSGRSFTILKPKDFVAEILPEHFKSAKYSSFTRKLHRWGFMRHYRGEEAGAFYHKDFQKDNLDLVEKMTCHKGEPSKAAAAVGSSNKRPANGPMPRNVPSSSSSAGNSSDGNGLDGFDHARLGQGGAASSTTNTTAAMNKQQPQQQQQLHQHQPQQLINEEDMKRPGLAMALSAQQQQQQALLASAVNGGGGGMPDMNSLNFNSMLQNQQQRRRVPTTLPPDIMLQLQQQQQQLRISDNGMQSQHSHFANNNASLAAAQMQMRMSMQSASNPAASSHQVQQQPPAAPPQMDSTADRLNVAIELEVNRRLKERIQAATISQAFSPTMQAPQPQPSTLAWNNIQGQNLRNVLIEMELAKRRGTLDPALLALVTGNYSRLARAMAQPENPAAPAQQQPSQPDLPRTNIQGARTA